MRNLLPVLAVAAALAAAPASQAETTVTRETYTNFVQYVCFGEDVLFEGVLQTRQGEHTDASGRTHATLELVIVADGVGQVTGLRYHLHAVNPFSLNYDGNGGSTGVIRERVIQQGGGVAFFDFNVRLTITPDGEIVVLRIEEDLGCHGNPSTP